MFAKEVLFIVCKERKIELDTNGLNIKSEETTRLDRGSIRSSPRDGLGAPYRLTKE